MRRWATKEHDVKKANVWIGFTIDELKRVKTELGKWEYKYPLVERRLSRTDCIQLVKKMGWPEPPRSSCYMCPNHTQPEWRHIKQNQPEDWENAVDFEQRLRKQDDSMYLHQDRIILPDADLGEDQQDMFTGRCDSGMCFV